MPGLAKAHPIIAPTLLATVLIVLAMFSSHGVDAVPVPILQGVPFYLYAVLADDWVRNDVRYTLNRLRAADGISKGEATQFVAFAQGGNTGDSLNTFTSISLKALTGSHPWCVPTTTDTGLINGTLICETDVQPPNWLTIFKKLDTTYHGPLYAGDTIRLMNGYLNCGAPPWPTNSASLYCGNTGTDNWRDIHIEV